MHYVVGDIHGCYEELQRVISKIEKKDSNPVIIFVGDIIDRGPEVIKTLTWCLEHVSADGKFRCVLGNHEDMLLNWYQEVKDYWDDELPDTLEKFPKLRYGFDEKLKEAGLFTHDYIRKVITFFQSLPLRIDLSIASPVGKIVDYTIAHAYIPCEEHLDNPRQTYLWSRKHYWGYHGDEDRILVHGHTPTISFEYLLRNRHHARPGMIVYSSERCINVDSGCCYHYLGNNDFPCYLSAICLETLDEIYSDDLASRFEDVLKRTNDEYYELDPVAAINFKIEQYWENLGYSGYQKENEFCNRSDILEKLGM